MANNSIVDKLNNLKQVKTAIGDAIRAKGGALATPNNFNSYAQAIRDLPSGGGLSVTAFGDAVDINRELPSFECRFNIPDITISSIITITEGDM